MVDFVLVSALLTVLFVAVVQVAMVQHVRNTLVDCASEGARYGALADRRPGDAVTRTRELIIADLGPRYAGDITAGRERFEGLDTVVVRVRGPLPVLGLLGTSRMIQVTGHADLERP